MYVYMFYINLSDAFPVDPLKSFEMETESVVDVTFSHEHLRKQD